MIARIHSGVNGGTIEAISSKSFAHRMLICSALSDNNSQLRCNVLSQDMVATMQCLISLGANITYANSFFYITPIANCNSSISNQRSVDRQVVLQCKECGSVLRFLLPVTAALGFNAEFNGEGRLPERPIGEILRLLEQNGVSVSGSSLPVKLSGQLCNGIMHIDGTVSSQFITGLLMALPLLKGDSVIIVDGEQLSKPYIDITLNVLKNYGIQIIANPDGYTVRGEQKYFAPEISAVEGDWSNAAFWIALGAISGEKITITGISPNSLQGDRVILTVAAQMGAHIVEEIDSVTVENNSSLECIEFDVRNVPDIVPVIAMMCNCAVGKSIIKNVNRLRDKESDRLNGIINILNSLGGYAYCSDNNLIIEGQGYSKLAKPFSVCVCDSEEIILNGLKDHRMVMMGILAGALYGNITVTDVEAINKSYPTFFEHFASIGGRFNCIK